MFLLLFLCGCKPLPNEFIINMAEGVGFEPTDPCGSPVFKTGAINHSTIPPIKSKSQSATIIAKAALEPLTDTSGSMRTLTHETAPVAHRRIPSFGNREVCH